ncbi:MAG: hypothetical protein ABJF23_19145 [Bryobacteraceae bacterium]
MVKVIVNHKTWVESGKKAAESGKNGTAIYALCVLLDLFITYLKAIIDNQFELHAAIAKLEGPAVKR